MFEQGTQEQAQFAFTTDDIQLVPRKGLVKSRKEVYELIGNFMFSAPMDKVTGFEMCSAMLREGQSPVLSRFISKDEYWETIQSFAEEENFWVAVGLTDYTETVTKIRELNLPLPGICIDIAHGHSMAGLKAIKDLIALGATKIMSGSIATSLAAIDCIAAGATHLRLGVSPGSMCSTAIMTGFGLPLASTVYNINKALLSIKQRNLVTLIADGGIRNPGDAAKLMALGADSIMLGSELAWTRESPGWEPSAAGTPYQRLQKKYRGQASAEFQTEVLDRTPLCPEGASTEAKVWTGETVKSLLKRYKWALSSATSYAGCLLLEQLPSVGVEFVFVSSNGRREATPHGLEK